MDDITLINYYKLFVQVGCILTGVSVSVDFARLCMSQNYEFKFLLLLLGQFIRVRCKSKGDKLLIMNKCAWLMKRFNLFLIQEFSEIKIVDLK